MAEAKSRARQNGDFDTIFDSTDPIPVSVISSDSVEMVKQNKVTLSTSAQMVTLDSLVKLQVTSRSSAITYLSVFGNEDGVAQVETNTIASGVTEAGDLDVTVTADGMTGSPKTITATVLGILQQETITCTAGESGGAGNITMTVTAAGMTNSPKAVVVAVALSDGVNDVGLALRTALAADADVGAFFTVSGATDAAIITSKVAIANDATMAFSFADTDSTGVTFGASTDTTAGEAASTAAEVAEIVKDALNADGVIGVDFTATRSGVTVILTAASAAANDTTMNLGVAEGTASGFTDSAKSANTTAGYAAGDWDEIGGHGTLMMEPPTNTTNSSPFTFVWIKTSAGTPAVILRGWKEA